MAYHDASLMACRIPDSEFQLLGHNDLNPCHCLPLSPAILQRQSTFTLQERPSETGLTDQLVEIQIYEVEKDEEGNLTSTTLVKTIRYTYPAPCGVVTESPYGTGQFSGKSKRL